MIHFTVLPPRTALIYNNLGRSTRSGTIFSPYNVQNPLAVPDIDIYTLIAREEEHRATRQLDEDAVELEPLPADLTKPAPHINLVPDTSAPPQPSATYPDTRSNRKKKRAAYHHSRRNATKRPPSTSAIKTPKRVTHKHMQESTPLHTTIDTAQLNKTKSAWTGIRIPKPQARLYSLQELQDLGFSYIAWDGWSCRPLIDAKNRVFALLGGRPHRNQHGFDSYEAAITEATRLFDENSAAARGDGRRGDFVAVSAGESFGGGQERPGNLRNTKGNAAITAVMLASWAFKRIAGFTNGLFITFAPALHAFYVEQMSLLHRFAPYLVRIFAETISVFAACTFNFGPCTVTLPHVDAANLAWGWCCITALGCFNPDLGGHLILWDLNLVIRFPPGSTIMIPSALLRHSNVSVQQGETRYSFTQYTAGGLFRWVYNGHQSDKDFLASATAQQLKERDADRSVRWENGVRMFTVWDPKEQAFSQQSCTS
ncbi:hypothetical protein C8R43DRAFT_1138585 [Mycena crocata]|nr:hypothetical protein C8R43DRAFT_1138585 [Mycena crocata]